MADDLYFVTRRDFLKTATIAGMSLALPAFLTRTAEAKSGAPDGDTILVVLQLGGGNDGLNTVVPYSNDDYHRARKRLALSKGDLLPIDGDIALHHELKGLRSLYDDGSLAIINGAGYPNPNRSHFRSMEIWHTATDSDRYSSTGWIGRYFDNCCGGSPDPGAAVNVGPDLPQAFDSESGAGISFENPDSFKWEEGRGPNREETFRRLNRPGSGHDPEKSTLDFLRHTTGNIITSSAEIREASSLKRKTAEYPGSRLGRQLRDIATLIAAGMPTRIYYTSHGGFDTHANQAGQHNNLLRQFSEAVAAFQQDLKVIGAHRRVVTMCFSEFGRRVEENASGGTDHGTAGPMFLLGEGIKPGLHGRYPSLTDLDGGDLKHSVDFRAVYAELIEKQLRADSAKVLGKKFDRIGVMG